ncbi:MAG: TolC family protein, partial [Gammaproteobacteria bacterium]
VCSSDLAERATIARRVALGDVAALDLDRAEATVAELGVAIAEARRLREEARVALVTDFPQLVLPAAPPAIPLPRHTAPTDDALVGRIVDRSHEIGIAETIAAGQDLTARRSAASRRPDPSIGLRLLDEGNHQEQLVGLVLQWSFPTAANRATAIAEGHLAAARAVEAEAVRRDVERGARQLLAALPARISAWEAARVALASSKAALARVEAAYTLGEAGFSDLGLARRQHQGAAEHELLARLDLHESWLRIDVDSHELWARHLHADDHDHVRVETLMAP